MTKKFVLCACIALSMTGCGWVGRKIAWWSEYSKVCIAGVTYYQFDSGAALGVDLNGKPIPCE